MPSVKTAAVFPSGNAALVEPALDRLRAFAATHGVEIVDAESSPDIAVVLGGDGTMLRALTRYLGSGVPVIGVNFGRVGFLTAIEPETMEDGLARAFAGDFEVIRLPTLEVEVGGRTYAAVNDAVITSGTIGRIVELGYALGEEDLGSQRCDGLVCATPQGSTAYNLSNGGPVLVWGLDAMVMTFVAPHSLYVRPLVVPRGPDLRVTNASSDVPTTVIVDGHAVASLQPGEQATLRIDARDALLATLPDVTFFSRYAATFGR
jgi:NAD+ kinase